MIGVIPAGGAATRLQPIKHSKEMTLVGGKPIIEYLVEKMTPLCREIIVVSRENKKDLNLYCQKRKFRVVFQQRPELSGALVDGFLLAKKNEDSLWGLPDTLWMPVKGFDLITKIPGNVLGLFPVSEPERFTVIEEKNGRVVGVYGKVPNPPSNYIWGIGKINQRYLKKAVLAVEKQGGSNTCEEIIRNLPFKSVPFKKGIYLDIGVPEVFGNLKQFIKEFTNGKK